MELGEKIKVNNSEIETLIKKEGRYGLFKSLKYQVVRNLQKILDKQKLTNNENTGTNRD